MQSYLRQTVHKLFPSVTTKHTQKKIHEKLLYVTSDEIPIAIKELSKIHTLKSTYWLLSDRD